MKVIKKIFLGIFGLAVCYLTVLLSVILCFVICLVMPCKINNIHQYHDVRNEQGYNTHILFPENLDNIEYVNEFHYHEYALNGSERILDVIYSDNEFKKEIERISSLTYNTGYKHIENRIVFDNAILFNLPTYVTIYNSYVEYEYASIIEEENRVVYVHLDGIANEKIGIDELFIPKNYDINEQNSKEFSIYKEGVNSLYE